MNNFTERHHAFISASFYQLLTEKFEKRGESAFIMATQRYAEQRGSRMAQRAIRDGKELSFETYNMYGEWKFTKEAMDEIASKHSGKQIEVQNYSPHYEYYVYACPWNLQYKDMELLDGACVYCSHLDNSIARGFNPYLEFKVAEIIHKGQKCHHILKNAYLNKDNMPQKDSKNMMPFDYHCGHIYKTFSEIVESIFKAEGALISAKVLESFMKEYGSDMVDKLYSYRDTNFNIIS